MLTVKTYLDKSKVNGTGCFAAEFIKAGTVIWKLQKNFDTILTHAQFAKLPKVAQDFVLHFAYYNRKEGGYVLCMDNSKYFNHSEDPNTDDTGEYTTALRDIKKGEEIVSNYYTFDEAAHLKIGEQKSGLTKGSINSNKRYLYEDRARLITLFKFEPQKQNLFFLSYEYRKKYSTYKQDKLILEDLIKEKLVKVHRKDNTTIVFQYLGT